MTKKNNLEKEIEISFTHEIKRKESIEFLSAFSKCFDIISPKTKTLIHDYSIHSNTRSSFTDNVSIIPNWNNSTLPYDYIENLQKCLIYDISFQCIPSSTVNESTKGILLGIPSKISGTKYLSFEKAYDIITTVFEKNSSKIIPVLDIDNIKYYKKRMPSVKLKLLNFDLLESSTSSFKANEIYSNSKKNLLKFYEICEEEYETHFD